MVTSTSRHRRLRFRGVPFAAEEAEGEAEGDSGLVALLGLRVVVADPSEAPPQLETDESYVLEVRAADRSVE
jgi:hypothetical protein